MIGLVLVAHGEVATQMWATVELVLGPQRDVATIAVHDHDSISAKRTEIADAIRAVRREGGVLILTDMVGGTPSNLAMRELRGGGVAMLTGMNMPMLITVAQYRQRQPLHLLAESGLEAGRKYMGMALSAPSDAETAS